VRVVIDAGPAVDPRRTGVGHYTGAILQHLPPADPENRYVAWYLDVRGLGSKPRRFAGIAPNLSEHASRIPSRVYGPVSIRTGFPRLEWLAGNPDVVMATNFLPPATGHPERAVLVVHDLAWKILPASAPHHDERWRRLFTRALRSCAGVIVPSAAVRDDLLEAFPVGPHLVHVVHHGTDADAFQPASPPQVEDVRRRYGIDGPYVLFLGGLEPRKNVQTLVRAFALVRDERARLVLAGGQVNWAPDYAAAVETAIGELPPERRSLVVRTGYVPDEDRRALLSGAEVLAYPSLLEGFGFPVLEGFAANVPVLTSNVSSLPEVAGDAAMLVDPADPAAIAAALDQLLADEDLRNVLRAAGMARVAAFTWERCARETAAVLRTAHDTASE
jgi:glycosyltransferase involved in cell wall biosynthesis